MKNKTHWHKNKIFRKRHQTGDNGEKKNNLEMEKKSFDLRLNLERMTHQYLTKMHTSIKSKLKTMNFLIKYSLNKHGISIKYFYHQSCWIMLVVYLTKLFFKCISCSKHILDRNQFKYSNHGASIATTIYTVFI